jgi:hypothetical protein
MQLGADSKNPSMLTDPVGLKAREHLIGVNKFLSCDPRNSSRTQTPDEQLVEVDTVKGDSLLNPSLAMLDLLIPSIGSL